MMENEAESHADYDNKKKDAVEARNMLDGAVYQAEKMKADNKDKISEDDIKAIDEAVEKAKKVVADEKADKDALEAAAKELNDVLMPIGAKMYENTASDSAESPEDGKSTKDNRDGDAPIEGEVVDDKEEK
jgi:molecular chaperone DnaK